LEAGLEGEPKDTRALPLPGGENEEALAEWVSLLYAELRRLASYYLQRERGNHTLQATALVHEAYLRFLDQRQIQWENRNQFMAVDISVPFDWNATAAEVTERVRAAMDD
jgi:hypothetical protein